MAKTIGGIDVCFTDSNRNFHEWWIEYGPSKKVLPKGWQREPDRLALKEDLIWEKDVAVTLRDGVKLRADVFRPAKYDGKPLPALLPWSPYGKTGSGKSDASQMDSVNRLTAIRPSPNNQFHMARYIQKCTEWT